jgi:cell wall-associated NlpC family hydrolase
MQQALLRIAFDAGAREISSVLSGLVGGVMVILLIVVFLPVVLVASMLGAPSADRTAPRSQIQAAAVPPTPTAPLLPSEPQDSSRIVEMARRYLGIPYVFGSTDPRYGVDCSGLVQLVFRQAGISLPRTAQLQFNATARLSRDQLQPGDLVFFARTYDDPHDWITHVGIYIGNGMQINAPTEGEVVSIQPVFTGFWGSHFAGGGRA